MGAENFIAHVTIEIYILYVELYNEIRSLGALPNTHTLGQSKLSSGLKHVLSTQ